MVFPFLASGKGGEFSPKTLKKEWVGVVGGGWSAWFRMRWFGGGAGQERGGAGRKNSFIDSIIVSLITLA